MPSFASVLVQAMRRISPRVLAAPTLAAAREALSGGDVEAVLLDVCLPDLAESGVRAFLPKALDLATLDAVWNHVPGASRQ